MDSAFLEHPCRQPSSAAFDIRHHHHLFHSGRRALCIRFEPSLRETLVDSNHRCRASIRTLNRPFWARCKLGFDHKPRFITMVTNLGLLGAAIYFAVFIDREQQRSHPDKAVEVVAYQTFQIALGFCAINSSLLPCSCLLQQSLRLVLCRIRGACFLLWLTSSLGSYRRRYRRGRALAQRLIYLSPHPEAVQ